VLAVSSVYQNCTIPNAVVHLAAIIFCHDYNRWEQA
jgi:hypothetical protein